MMVIMMIVISSGDETKDFGGQLPGDGGGVACNGKLTHCLKEYTRVYENIVWFCYVYYRSKSFLVKMLFY